MFFPVPDPSSSSVSASGASAGSGAGSGAGAGGGGWSDDDEDGDDNEQDNDEDVVFDRSRRKFVTSKSAQPKKSNSSIRHKSVNMPKLTMNSIRK